MAKKNEVALAIMQQLMSEHAEVAASSFSDHGDDWCEMRFKRKNGTVQKVRVGGY